MPVRVQTGALLGLLTDLIHTAAKDPDAGAIGSVMLHTSRGAVGDEPGTTDLLAGGSTDRFVAGHTYTSCTGQLTGGPTVWAVRDVKSVIAVFKPAAKDVLHSVEVTRDGQLLTVREDPNLFDDGLRLSFAQGSLADYPGLSLYRNLDRYTADKIENPDDGSVVEALARTDLGSSQLDAFVKIAARRKTVVQLYRTHQSEAILVQIGGDYRGVLMPSKYEADGDERRPDAEVHFPDLEELARLSNPPGPGEPADDLGAGDDLFGSSADG